MYEYKIVEAHSRADLEKELEERAEEGWEVRAFHIIPRMVDGGTMGIQFPSLYAALMERRKPLVETF